VSDTETASWIAALERARAELESALSADASWHAPCGAGGDVDWAGYEAALARNPVFRCWAQLNGAIEDLRRHAQPAPPGRRRVSLREVIEHIRAGPALPEPTAPASEAAETQRMEAASAAGSDPGLPAAAPMAEGGHARPEAEEATVSFVIREPAPPAVVAPDRTKASAAKKPIPPKSAEPDPGTEAEVFIVPRRR
jgi:hypothetical protein